MNRSLLIQLATTIAFICFLAPVTVAAREVTAKELLAAADGQESVFTDQAYRASMAIYKGGSLSNTAVFDITFNWPQRLIIFRSPRDVAGTILRKDADTLYILTPDLEARRVAPHEQNQGFLGSEFTYEDMTDAFAQSFDAELKGRAGSESTLSLARKKSATSTYPLLEIVLDDALGITLVRYFDGSGRQMREQRRQAWKPAGPGSIPTRITMLNLKTGDHTVVTLRHDLLDPGSFR